jgi:hypothetical protein
VGASALLGLELGMQIFISFLSALVVASGMLLTYSF